MRILKNKGLITQELLDLSQELLGLSKEPDLLNDIRKKINIRLIESQRLLDVNNSDSSTMHPTVSTYSKELAKLIRDKFAEYGKESQSLDRTFPIRAAQQQHSTDLTDEQLKEQLNELEDTRNHLTELGLLDKDENVDFPTQLQDIDESTRNILSVYNEKHAPWEVCRSHDLVKILAIALHKLIGTNNKKEVEPDILERSLILAYEKAWFIKTEVYQDICTWEKNNQPFKVLNTFRSY